MQRSKRRKLAAQKGGKAQPERTIGDLNPHSREQIEQALLSRLGPVKDLFVPEKSYKGAPLGALHPHPPADLLPDALNVYLDMLRVMGDYKRDKEVQRQVKMQRDIKRIERMIVGKDHKTYAQWQGDNERVEFEALWSALSTAAIFDIDPSTYFAVADVVEKEQHAGAGVPLLIDGLSQEELDEYALKLIHHIKAEGKHRPLPEKRPFENFYLAYGKGVMISPEQFADPHFFGGRTEEDRHPKVGRLAGHLIDKHGRVYACFYGLTRAQDLSFWWLYERNTEGDWARPLTGHPWIVPALIREINTYGQTLIETTWTSGQQKKIEATRVELKVKHKAPQPYYVVKLTHQLKFEDEKHPPSAIHRTIEWAHRWSVRGHPVLRIRRGSLPLDPELEEQLREVRRGASGGYRIFKDEAPGPRLQKILDIKGIAPKREGEWLAVLVSWRKDFVKGPIDAPFVPSVRRLPHEANPDAILLDLGAEWGDKPSDSGAPSPPSPLTK